MIFRASYTGEGRLEGATLSLLDYRYDGAKFLPDVILYTDGAAWEMKAATKYTPHPVEGADSPYKNENKMFLVFPRASLARHPQGSEHPSALLVTTTGRPSTSR